jgi:hypothetical protein
MKTLRTRLILAALMVAGAAGWAVLGGNLRSDGKLDHRPNPLCLKGSPFGRTIALAMRGPADVYWHRGEVHEHGPDHHEHGPDCGHEHGADPHGSDGGDPDEPGGPEEPVQDTLVAQIRRLAAEQAEHEAEEHDHDAEPATPGISAGLRPFLLDRIDSMRKAYYSRSNQRGDTRLHRAYIMSETERRLALSYHMDPANIACYGSYFLFLSEALARVEGSRSEDHVIANRQQAALDLANHTVQYCLKYQDEAPAMLTAATAAHDYLQISLGLPQPDLREAAGFLEVLDGCLQRFESLRDRMIEAGIWEKFPVHRRAEMDQAHALVRVLRKADHQWFRKLSSQAVSLVDPGP